MPWCPLCKTEYRKGFETCSDCGSVLVEELEADASKKDRILEFNCDHEVYLTSASDEIEAGLIESFLNSEKIPVMRKQKEAGNYMNIYMGNSFLGVDIYVPSKLYDNARALLDAKVIEQEADEENDPEFDETEREMQRKRMIRSWFMVLICAPGAFAVLIFGVMRILDKIF